MRRAAIYCRISDDREGAGLGVARQEADCRERATRLGWKVAGLYVDNDLSAFSGKTRPEYRRMLDDLSSGVIDGVIAWHTDRLHRSARELEEFIDICEKASVAVETVKAGPVDLVTPAGRAVARTLGAWARYESEHKAERNRRKALELAQAGKPSGGGRPFGYEEDRITIRENEAKVVRECVRLLLQGDSLRGLTRDLNSRGILTAAGGQWSTQTLKRVLASGRISGQRDHQPRSQAQTKRHLIRDIVGDAVWPPIITKEETARVRALLMDPHRRSMGVTARRCLLSGILRCACCGGGLCGRPTSDGRLRYLCKKEPGSNRCGKIFIVASPTDECVTDMVMVALQSPKLVEMLQAKGRSSGDESILQQIAGDEQKLEQLAGDYATDVITRKEWLRARELLEGRLEAARKRLSRNSHIAALEGLYGDSVSFGEVWEDLSLDRRRAVIAALFDRITVHPGVQGRNRFDPQRLEPVWRV
ncbi:MAG: recombinase family protein [Pseudonocardiales bacterium]|nr:recombinase family protein [Pseudonocardiales bacterium]